MKITREAFVHVKVRPDRAVDLMENISVASEEQSRGIDQVNTVIAEMNVSTQQNAGNAESLSGRYVHVQNGCRVLGERRFVDAQNRYRSGRSPFCW